MASVLARLWWNRPLTMHSLALPRTPRRHETLGPWVQNIHNFSENGQVGLVGLLYVATVGLHAHGPVWSPGHESCVFAFQVVNSLRAMAARGEWSKTIQNDDFVSLWITLWTFCGRFESVWIILDCWSSCLHLQPSRPLPVEVWESFATYVTWQWLLLTPFGRAERWLDVWFTNLKVESAKGFRLSYLIFQSWSNWGILSSMVQKLAAPSSIHTCRVLAENYFSRFIRHKVLQCLECIACWMQTALAFRVFLWTVLHLAWHDQDLQVTKVLVGLCLIFARTVSPNVTKLADLRICSLPIVSRSLERRLQDGDGKALGPEIGRNFKPFQT